MVAEVSPTSSKAPAGSQLSSLQFLALALCSLGFTFDLWEMGLNGVLSTVFAARADESSARYLPWLVSSVYVGALIGTPLFGLAGDRIGRRKTLSGLLALMGVASIVAAMAPTMLWAAVFRGVAGAALGAFPPVMFAYLTDILPPARRGKLLVVVSAIGALGTPAAIFFVRGLAGTSPGDLAGWQWALLVGGGGAVLTSMAIAMLPESPRWLQVVGRHAEATREFGRFGLLATKEQASQEVEQSTPTPTSRWLLMIALFFLSSWALVSFPIVSGPILLHKGFQLSDTLFYLGVAAFGPPVGSLVASLLIDEMDRRVSLSILAALLVITTLVFALGTSAGLLMATSTAFNLIALIYIPVLYIYAAEQFRTRERSFAVSISWTFNRLGSAVAPLVLLPLLARAGVTSVTAVMISALLLSVLLIVTVAPAGPPRQALR